MLSLVPHFLHFPFCTKKLTSGISSITDKVCQHLSHFERQKSIDLIHLLFRFLLIRTHQNEPKIVHNTKNINILQNNIYNKYIKYQATLYILLSRNQESISNLMAN